MKGAPGECNASPGRGDADEPVAARPLGAAIARKLKRREVWSSGRHARPLSFILGWHIERRMG